MPGATTTTSFCCSLGEVLNLVVLESLNIYPSPLDGPAAGLLMPYPISFCCMTIDFERRLYKLRACYLSICDGLRPLKM